MNFFSAFLLRTPFHDILRYTIFKTGLTLTELTSAANIAARRRQLSQEKTIK